MTGFYRRVRNPIYVGLIAIIIGEALILGDESMLAYAMILWLFFHVLVLVIEEPGLHLSFGGEFASYKANVPRWLPRLTPWAGPASSEVKSTPAQKPPRAAKKPGSRRHANADQNSSCSS